MCTKHFGANSLTKGKLFSTAANLQSRVGSYLISLAFTHLVISLQHFHFTILHLLQKFAPCSISILFKSCLSPGWVQANFSYFSIPESHSVCLTSIVLSSSCFCNVLARLALQFSRSTLFMFALHHHFVEFQTLYNGHSYSGCLVMYIYHQVWMTMFRL